eukprot:449230_1
MMSNQKKDQKLVCQCGDNNLKPYKQPRRYLNPKCDTCHKRSDCYICGSCNNAFCAHCSNVTETEIRTLLQKLKQNTLDNIYADVINKMIKYKNLDKNDNFSDMIMLMLSTKTINPIRFYQQCMNENDVVKQKSFYINYLKEKLFDYIIKNNINPLIFKECLNYLNNPFVVFRGKMLHPLIDSYFLSKISDNE